jgi:hypothetical protein
MLDKPVKRQRIDRMIRNLYADIRTDMKVETERSPPISENCSDQVIKDHKRKMIFIELIDECKINGISIKESEKVFKYEKVRQKFAQRTCYDAVIIPYVNTNRNVNVENWKYRKILGISS